MSIEVRPVGVTCNLRCSYCYEQPVRDIEPVHRYDKEKVLAQLQHVTGSWSLFGGEALLIPLSDLEELLQIAFDRWKYSGVQTNGTLITPSHIELFHKYNTHIGISLDGPDELNDSRWAGTVEATRRMTARTHEAIDMLLAAAKEKNNPALIPSFIVTLHAGNASVERWPRMKQWLQECDEKGIKHYNFHLMELDYKATKDSEWYLPHDRVKEIMLDLWDLSKTFKNAKILNFEEFFRLLEGKDNTQCVWHTCDPWNTSAVQGLEGDGSPSHCTRTNKDGLDWLPAEGQGLPAPWQVGTFKDSKRHHERQLSLYVTPQEDGGCKDCRFWIFCQGHCPGMSEESSGTYGDWRLRSTYCQTWKDMLGEAERRMLLDGKSPVSLHPKLKEIENIFYTVWSNKGEIYLSEAIAVAEEKKQLNKTKNKIAVASHGDHTDQQHKDMIKHEDHIDMTVLQNQEHGDHTDIIPHGDNNREHGDHTDIIPHGDHHTDHLNL
jgi:uncharacterized protein